MVSYSFLILLPLLIIFTLCIIAVLALIIYKAVCNHRIKKQLSGEATYKRRYIEPHRIIIIILSVMLVVMFLALTAVYNYTPPQSDMDNYQAIFYTPQELEESPLAVYKNAYTQKSLTGYTREEVTENNFRYIIYKSEEDYNSMLYPTFLMFIEYTGDEKFEGCVAMDSITVHGGSYSTAVKPDEVPEYYFVCSNIDNKADYHFTLGLFSDVTASQTAFTEQSCANADELFEFKL